MQEYWVNVYGIGLSKLNGRICKSIEEANAHLNNMVAYRIHVKLKPKPIVKPNAYDLGINFNWME